MRKLFIYFVMYLYIGLLSVNISLADEGSIELCSINTYWLNYNETTDRLYIPCSGSSNDLDILVVDPDTFQIEKTFSMDGYIKAVYPIDNGSTLIVLLSMIVGSDAFADGKLLKVDYDTGSILNEYYFPDNSPMTLIIDPTETYAYVTRGLNPDPQPMLAKFSLANLQLVDEVEIEDSGDCMVANSDFTKIFIKTDGFFHRNENDDYEHYEIEVIDPVTMNKYPPASVHFPPTSIEISNDGRLFISYSNSQDGYPGIFVVDTNTNQIVDKIVFADMGVNFMSYDAASQTLVGTLWPINYWSEILQDMLHGESNMIAVIDLTDPNYAYNIVTLGTQNHWGILAVPLADPNFRCRVFTTLEGVSPVVYYKDID